MQVFGRDISGWWLLALIPVFCLCLPLLLLGFVVAGHVMGGIFGPPAIWERTRHSPPRADLVGTYIEAELHWDRPKIGPSASLELHADGSMAVHGLPLDEGTLDCLLSGTGKWDGPWGDQGLYLDFVSDDSPGSCKSGKYGSLQLVGNAKPYRLYWILDDPDSGTGIWLNRQ